MYSNIGSFPSVQTPLQIPGVLGLLGLFIMPHLVCGFLVDANITIEGFQNITRKNLRGIKDAKTKPHEPAKIQVTQRSRKE